MSCGHGCGHGSSPWYGRNWTGGCWSEDVDQRIGRREQPRRAMDDPSAAEEMEARLAGLQRAVRRLEAELAELHAGGASGRPGPVTTAGPSDR
jgi:uncharacterized small protein (DUF1192 family)